MARPRKNNAEYFSHDANLRNNIKIRAIRSKYSQNIGYSAYNMLLEILTDADNFRIENTDLQKTLIAWDIGIDEDLYSDILDFMVSIGLMQRDKEWIWNDHLIERMQPVINKRKIMQERYQVRGVDQQPTPPDEPKPPKTPRPKKEKQFLTEEEWQIFIKEYQKKGPDDSSVYKAKEKFLKTPRKYKHSVSNEERDVWDDILSSLPKWKVSRKWVNGYIHNASTFIGQRLWEQNPEPYTAPASKQSNSGQAAKPQHRTSQYSDSKV